MSSSSSNYTARIAKIQIYDDLHSSSNDLKIGLSEKLWDELIKETVEDESEGNFILFYTSFILVIKINCVCIYSYKSDA
jgi:hypothetical protein